jgi:hypothetical protein
MARISEDPILKTKDDWSAVLKVSHTLDFHSMRSLAIDRLVPLTTSIDKIKMAQAYLVCDWFEDAYLDVCLAPNLPNEEDLVAIGFDVFRKIARAREALRSPKLRTHARDERRAIIRETFGLGHEGMRAPLHAQSLVDAMHRGLDCASRT